MPKFERQPVVVDAVQVKYDGDRVFLSHMPDWAVDALHTGDLSVSDVEPKGFALIQGSIVVFARPGDWIVYNPEMRTLSVDFPYNMEAYYKPLDPGFCFQNH